MDYYGVRTKTAAVDLALPHLAGQPMTGEEVLAMQGAHAISALLADVSPHAVDENARRARRVFFNQLSARCELLRGDPNAWSEIEAERIVESGTLSSRAGDLRQRRFGRFASTKIAPE